MTFVNEPSSPQRTVVLQDEALRRLRGFTAIPNAVLRHPRLSHGAKLTHGVLLSYAWQDEFCWPAQERLAKDMGCSVRQVQRFLVELKHFRFVDWKQQGLNRPNVYYILPLPGAPSAPVTPNEATNQAAPDTTNLSQPEATSAAALEATPMSPKEYSRKNTHQNVNVAQRISRNATSGIAQRHGNTRRRWQLSEEQLDRADALANTIALEIGQPENLRAYFARAAEAIEAGRPELIFEAISLTKEEHRAGKIVTTPSQYFHNAFRRLLRRNKPPADLVSRHEQTRAARDAFVSRSAFPTNP
jgi:hypothetical protein